MIRSGRTWKEADGRLVILLALLVYFLPLLISGRWNCEWCYPGIPLLEFPYADLRLISSSIVCENSGVDTHIENPCDFGKRLLNYPRFWLSLERVGLSEVNNVTFGILLSLFYLLSLWLLFEGLSLREGVMVSVILLSPSLMLAVERGNIDLLVFLGLSLAVSCWRLRLSASLSYLLLCFSGCIKLFPILALSSAVREGYRKMWIPILPILLVFSALLYSIRSELPAIHKGTTQYEFFSYGLRVCQMHLQHYALPWGIPPLALIVAVLLLSGLGFLIFLSDTDGKGEESWRRDAFRIGTSIYCGSFLLHANWDYRLIFLLFTLPQLFSWAKQQGRWHHVACLTIATESFFVWASALGTQYIYLDEVSSILLFGELSALFLRSLPSKPMPGIVTHSLNQ